MTDEEKATKEAEKNKVKTVVEEVELGEQELALITDATKEALLPEVKALLEASEKGIKETIEDFIAKQEDVKKVKVNGAAGDEDVDQNDPIAKGLADGTIDKDVAAMTPAMRFYVGMKALIGDSEGNPDKKTLKKINTFNIASQVKARKELKTQDQIAKTGYANETTQADGAVLVPDAEFVTTLFDNLPNYGVAFADADVRQTDRTSVRVISLDSGLTFYSTAEAGVKTSAKLAFSKNEVSLQKYAVIVPATDELTDDAAIDYWNVVTRELTRAYAKVADEITFINATTGITNLTGVLTYTLGAAGAANLDWDDLLLAEAKTEDDLDESNFKWYMRKETWYVLLTKKGTTNDHYIYGSLNSGFRPDPTNPTTPWGRPVKFTRVLPTINTVSTNDAIAVFGNLRNYILYNKRGMALKMLAEASIVDADGTTTNLATQDISAMRAVIRLLGTCPKGNRTKFVVLGSGNVS
jgi:HK97 family phage major capsid protein